MEKLLPRFLEYVTTDTQSDPYSKTTPSTEKQWDLAKKLVMELHQIGMQEVSIDENAYIMATLPSNLDKKMPTIGFVSHFDTSPDFSGKNVKPQIIENYDGKDIILNKLKNIVLSPDYFEDLKAYEGQTLITTDGTTLLGADDKAGIAEIITAMEYLINHPEIKHGKIRIAFTPDEEIGRGAHKFDVEKFGAEWAYTMDGSQVGELEYENFNAAAKFILDHLDTISLFAGTHNEASSYLILDLMKEKGIAKNDNRVWFGQLYGMSDHISFNLAHLGYNVAKYVPFGPVKDVLPYLIRRAEENTSVAGQTGRELMLLTKEKARRKS